MKAHIGVDEESGLVCTVIGMSANVLDIEESEVLLHGEETDVYAGAGYKGIEKREGCRSALAWRARFCAKPETPGG